MSLEISAVICTYKRVPYLLKALDSLNSQTLRKSRYEIIVVDNSAEATANEAVAEAAAVRGNLRYVHERTAGLTAARNCGLRQARGKYIAYLDDDAVADNDWLERAIEVHEAHRGTIGMLGGLVRPIFETARPAWLTDDLLPFLSMTNLGATPAEQTGAAGLVGTNMIFRTQALRGVGGFSEQLGRKGWMLLSNEELQVKALLEKEGLKSLYHPQVAVSHHVVGSRLTKRWFRRRMYWQGRSDAVSWQQQSDAPAANGRFREALSATTLIAKHAAHWLHVARPRGLTRSRFASECHLLSRLGYVVGLARTAEMGRIAWWARPE